MLLTKWDPLCNKQEIKHLFLCSSFVLKCCFVSDSSKTNHLMRLIIRSEMVNKMENRWNFVKPHSFWTNILPALWLVSGLINCLQLNNLHKSLWFEFGGLYIMFAVVRIRVRLFPAFLLYWSGFRITWFHQTLLHSCSSYIIKNTHGEHNSMWLTIYIFYCCYFCYYISAFLWVFFNCPCMFSFAAQGTSPLLCPTIFPCHL